MGLVWDGSTWLLDDGSLTVAKIAATTLVTEAEGLDSGDDDDHIPTTAAVIDALGG